MGYGFSIREKLKENWGINPPGEYVLYFDNVKGLLTDLLRKTLKNRCLGISSFLKLPPETEVSLHYLFSSVKVQENHK